MTTPSDGLAQLFVGLETAMLVIVNELHHQKVIHRDQIRGALERTVADLDDGSGNAAMMMMRQLIAGLQGPQSPDDLRRLFRVIDGGRSEPDSATPPKPE